MVLTDLIQSPSAIFSSAEPGEDFGVLLLKRLYLPHRVSSIVLAPAFLVRLLFPSCLGTKTRVYVRDDEMAR